MTFHSLKLIQLIQKYVQQQLLWNVTISLSIANLDVNTTNRIRAMIKWSSITTTKFKLEAFEFTGIRNHNWQISYLAINKNIDKHINVYQWRMNMSGTFDNYT